MDNWSCLESSLFWLFLETLFTVFFFFIPNFYVSSQRTVEFVQVSLIILANINFAESVRVIWNLGIL